MQTTEQKQAIFDRGDRLTELVDQGFTRREAGQTEGLSVYAASMAVLRHQKKVDKVELAGVLPVEGQILEGDEWIFKALTDRAAKKVTQIKGES